MQVKVASWSWPLVAIASATSNAFTSYPRRCVQQQAYADTQCYFAAGSNGEQSQAEELRFNLINLIRTEEDAREQDVKVKLLSSLVRAAILNDDERIDFNTEVDDGINLQEQITPLRRFLCNSSNANEHRGNFKVFTDEIAHDGLISLPSNTLFSMDKPFTFLRDSLSYQSKTKEKCGGMMYDYSELVVWCGSYSKYDLEYTSKVLDDMPIVQLLGRYVDGNSIDVELDSETFTVLKSMEILIDEKKGENFDNSNNGSISCRLQYEDLDIIEAVLSYNIDQVNSFLLGEEQQTIIKLIDYAVKSVCKDPLNGSKQPHLVLMVDSISATRIAAAISAWKVKKIQQQSERRVENLLNQALTVLTFGNLCQSFPDGPAYIHISMMDDPWTTMLGATPNNHSPADSASNGQNTIYFQGLSPFVYNHNEWSDQNLASVRSLKTHNAHNLNACTIQFLALIMRINGIQSFRALYDSANWIDPQIKLDINPRHFAVNYGKHGDLVIPPRIDDELLPSMIRATRGDQWLWSDIDFESLLPDEIEATSHLEESFGYSAFDELCEAFSCLSR